MEIQVKVSELSSIKTEALVIGLFEGQKELPERLAGLDKMFGGTLGRVISEADFKGKSKEMLLLYNKDKSVISRLLLIGLGKTEKASLETIRVAAGTAARRMLDLGIKSFCSELYAREANGLAVAEVTQAIVEATLLSLYQFTELKTDPEAKNKKVESFTLLLATKGDLADAKQGAEEAQAIAAGVYLTRDLVNMPGNIATPTYIAQQAQQMAGQNDLACQVLDRKEMESLGMGALLAVARGSVEPPKFIILEHNAGKPDLDTLVLVGKGVSFDTGGISIKPDEGMDRMKTDMSGGAAVIGAMLVVSKLKLPLHVVGVIPSVENMPSGSAFKPGDIVKAMNGKTIEVINTDSEGRMILADALCYVARFQPTAVVDIATLTGARTIALGDHAIGLFSKDDGLIKRLQEAGLKTYERVWPMPMFEEYGDVLKSFAADMKHMGGKPASSIVAATFLNNFVSYPWAHLDIAGMVSTETDRPYTPKWATGIGVRLFVQLLRNWVAEKK